MHATRKVSTFLMHKFWYQWAPVSNFSPMNIDVNVDLKLYCESILSMSNLKFGKFTAQYKHED